MPKLNLTIHIDQNGQQTIHSEGDPALWPLVGRLAAAAQTPIHASERHSTLAGGTGPHAMSDAAELAWFSDFWTRTTERACIVGRAMGGRRFAVLDATDLRLTSAEHPLNTALVTLGWKGVGDMQAWAEMTREHIQAGETREIALAGAEATAAPIREQLHLPASTSPLEVLVKLGEEYANKLGDAHAFEAQVDSIDAVLRPLVIAAEEDSPEEVADLVAARIRGAEEQDERIRAALEEAIGRTPDPSRSTLQLAHDLAEVLKAALER